MPTATTHLASTPTESPSGSMDTALATLQKVDNYPLYLMHIVGHKTDSIQSWSPEGREVDQVYSIEFPTTLSSQSCMDWSCSLFATLGNNANHLYGRNFDWEYSPAVLLITQPEDAYASVSMVDLSYIGFRSDQLGSLDQLPIEERLPLLEAVNLPFDGMNEKGLVVGMAAVPPGDMVADPAKPTLDSLGIIRQLLDRAANIAEALEMFKSNNIDWGSGPPLHYLVADQSGKAVLIEFSDGQIVVIANKNPYHLATNFLVSQSGTNPKGQCPRYDAIFDSLDQKRGVLSLSQALDLLESVSQSSTQWSVVYDFSLLRINIVMGRAFHFVHTFSFGEVMAR
jgi:Linear amide C-N hydrolases, choloylglycine hydrolase family